jgi:hypothetical protein
MNDHEAAMAKVTRERAKQIVDDYLAGRRAGRSDAPPPADASADFLHGYGDARHERRVAAAGLAYKRGEIDAKAFAAVFTSKEAHGPRPCEECRGRGAVEDESENGYCHGCDRPKEVTCPRCKGNRS